MKIFSGNSNLPLALKIAEKLKLKVLPVEKFVFPDGEQRVKINDRVVGEKVLVVQSANTPVDQNYMELFFLVDALKRSGAEFVTAIVPYFGYQRQDHVFRDGEAVSLEVMVRILESLKVDRLISLDMHSVKIPYLFNIPVTHLSAIPLFAKKIKAIIATNLNSMIESTCVLVSPDMGGISRIKQLSEILDLPFVALEKNRNLENGKLSGDNISEGSLKNKKIAFIVDDMISSGKTIDLATNTLFKKGVEKVFVFATHAIFSEDAPFILENSKVEKVFITDSVFVSEEKIFPKLEILSSAAMIAKAIKINL